MHETQAKSHGRAPGRASARRSRILAATMLVLALEAAGVAQPVGDVADEVFYHFMPIAWRDSDSDAYRYGDFGGMATSLDYLEQLGVTAIWMNPIFPSPAYHGYQHGPADQLNASFGDEAGWRSFVQQAHARGIKVFVDFVCYGISHNSIYFQSAFGNPASPYDTWLAFTNGANTAYLGSTYTTWNGASVGFIHWDLRTAAARDLVTQWGVRWLDPNHDGDFSDGVDGYRLDHVWVQYGSGPDGWGYNLDDFWTPWKAALVAARPSTFIFCEQADWGLYGNTLVPPFDAAMTKPFEFAAREALTGELATRLYSSMAQTVAAEPPAGTFLAIIGDHDVDRLASAIGDNFAKGRAAAAVLLTQPFPPILYYGDEIGMRGVKNNAYPSDASDIPMREPFKWNAVAGPPMSNYFVRNAAAYGGRVSRDNDGRSVQEQQGVAGSLLESYRALIAARRANVALRRGSYLPVTCSSPAVWAFVRHHAAQTLIVAINVSRNPIDATINLGAFGVAPGGADAVDVLTGVAAARITPQNQDGYPLSLPAYGYLVLETALTPPAPPIVRADGLNIPTDFVAAGLLATQDAPTTWGDNQNELNQLFVDADADGVRVGISGNLATNANALVLLLDTRPGGHGVLNTTGAGPPPSGLVELTGTRFDVGFEPDFMFFVNAFGGTLYVDQLTLDTGSPGVKTYRGRGVVDAGNGFLTGGTNPNGLQVALDNTNAAGVTASSAANAASATRGFEFFIPASDLALSLPPRGIVRVAAFITGADGGTSNQWLPGVGAAGALGPAPDLRNVPGAQFAETWLRTPGDLDCDGAVNNFDIDAFVLALTDAAGYAAAHPACDARNADLNGDGAVNAFDIDPFVVHLGGGAP
ncbi:MAG: alpha-amylase family glycosyl hydrolase [Phycisphaerae bacterium]